MKPKHGQIGTVSRAFNTKWCYGSLVYERYIPEGLKCKFFLNGDGNSGRWLLDEFPEEIFPRNSIERHDATHYGIPVPKDFINA